MKGGGRMDLRKGRARRWLRVVPLLALLGVTLVLVTSGQSGRALKPQVVGAGGGFGEVYKAKTATLKKTLFNAKLLPANKMARNIALAALGRADKKVNLNLALKCWKNNGCSTGTGGKLKVAYVEGFGENVFRQMSKMEFILQALTYKSVGRIIYTSAHSNPTQALTDFRAAISQHVNLIVTYPDFGDAMLPVFREATKAGIPVAT
jgi:ABC-type sugar transport system substrate-binding protein